MQLKVTKWGNSQGIRVPKKILEKIGVFNREDVLNAKIVGDTIVLSKSKKSRLARRFEGFNTEKYWAEWHKNHPDQSKEIDWGEPVGREYHW